MSTEQPAVYSIPISYEQSVSLDIYLAGHDFEKHNVQYADFAYKKPGLNIVFYTSGKLVVQGKGAKYFVEFVLEPEILQSFDITLQEHNKQTADIDFSPRAGLDESGKGDFFGPITTACVIAGPKEIKQLLKIGVKDSKKITSDRAARMLAEKIYQVPNIVVQSFALSLEKYNSLYYKFGANLNRLLGWMHSVSLKNALLKRYVPFGILDQFSKNPIVQQYIRKEFAEFNLTMQTKAESDPVVAAASIIARAEYIKSMEKLSHDADFVICKGASAKVIECGKDLVKKVGVENLKHFCKLHFKTLENVVTAEECQMLRGSCNSD